eukprot:COSAG02_NODE_27738_length_603_cov_1.537698_2_plen_28_part_01
MRPRAADFWELYSKLKVMEAFFNDTATT